MNRSLYQLTDQLTTVISFLNQLDSTTRRSWPRWPVSLLWLTGRGNGGCCFRTRSCSRTPRRLVSRWPLCSPPRCDVQSILSYFKLYLINCQDDNPVLESRYCSSIMDLILALNPSLLNCSAWRRMVCGSYFFIRKFFRASTKLSTVCSLKNPPVTPGTTDSNAPPSP